MIFYYLAKCVYSFDKALSTVKNCADRLFEYFKILLFVRCTYGISKWVKSNIFETCYSLLFIEAKKLLKQPGTFAWYMGKVSYMNLWQENGL